MLDIIFAYDSYFIVTKFMHFFIDCLGPCAHSH